MAKDDKKAEDVSKVCKEGEGSQSCHAAQIYKISEEGNHAKASHERWHPKDGKQVTGDENDVGSREASLADDKEQIYQVLREERSDDKRGLITGI